MKFVPLTLRVNAEPPTLPLGGDSAPIVGSGFGGVLITKSTVAEVPPPGAGFSTATAATPAEARSEAGICVVRDVTEANVVGNGLPFHRTWLFEMKFVPSTVRVNAGLPAIAPEGDSEVIAGSGLAAGPIVKVSAADVPPPGVGVSTITLALPAFAKSDAGT
jgi:hypothetical protein